jgi:hypothetical protein
MADYDDEGEYEGGGDGGEPLPPKVEELAQASVPTGNQGITCLYAMRDH